VDLHNRLRNYYSKKYMETVLKISRSAIYSAILKPPPPPPGGIGGEAKGHGIAKFKLEILVYYGGRRSHPTEKCIKIEQKFRNLLKP
jgi:hypothetical protein